jgi:vacuolar-type H+-ATPase subunit I/STV1
MKNSNKGSLFPIMFVGVVVVALVTSVYWFRTHSRKSDLVGDISDVRDLEEVDTPKEKTDSKPEVEDGGLNEVEEESESEENVEDVEDNVLEEKNVEEDESDESVVETLTLLLAQKHKKRVEDIKVTISKREGDYIVGGVVFSDEMSGGLLFAAKTNSAWKIVYDGNGVCSCSDLDLVSFPNTLVKECLDDNTSEVVAR